MSLYPTWTRDWGKGHNGGARNSRLQVAGHRRMTLTPSLGTSASWPPSEPHSRRTGPGLLGGEAEHCARGGAR